MVPPASTAVTDRITPSWRTMRPYMPATPASATSSPAELLTTTPEFPGSLRATLSVTKTWGRVRSSRAVTSTSRPAARAIWPDGAMIRPPVHHLGRDKQDRPPNHPRGCPPRSPNRRWAQLTTGPRQRDHVPVLVQHPCENLVSRIPDPRGIPVILGLEREVAPPDEVVVDIERRGHEGVDVHPGRGTEKDPVLIDQVDLAVPCEAAVDLARALVEDAVEGHPVRVSLLVEVGPGVLPDVERVPLDDRGLLVLVDHQLVLGGDILHTGDTLNDVLELGQGVGGGCPPDW